MQRCDPEGPALFFVSKLVPSPNKQKGMIAFGRLFSGTIKAGDSLRVLGTGVATGGGGGGDGVAALTAVVKGVVRMMAAEAARVDVARPGDIVGLLGVEQYIAKSATLASSPAAASLRVLEFSVSPVVRVAIAAAKNADTSKVLKAAQRLAKLDPCAICITNDRTGECIIAGVGELHIDVCVRAVATLAGCDVTRMEPCVSHVETVTAAGPTCLAKSANKHNRAFVRAEPLDDHVVAAIEANQLHMELLTPVELTSRLMSDHGWERAEARKVLAIHPSGCVFVDGTVGIDLAPLRQMLILSFDQTCVAGPLCAEPLRGVKFVLTDAKYHADSPHRRPDQVGPMARNAFRAAMLSAAPILSEPVFAVEVQVPGDRLKPVAVVLKKRRGKVQQDVLVAGTPLHIVGGVLPVAESFGFVGELQSATAGHAFTTCSFSHWDPIGGDPWGGDGGGGGRGGGGGAGGATGGRLAALIGAIRSRNGLASLVPPTAADYRDTL
jgi:elongation factor 2